MQRHATKPAPDVPKWSALLVEAVNKPGLIMEAYSAFHNYSIGNQFLALVQCQLRGLEPGPINTFPGWQALGRTVKRGERALILCMPITRKVRDEEAPESEGENGERRFTSFMHKARWFAISQTVGDEFTAPRLPEWEAERALAALDIERIAFTDPDGNCQGYARKRQIAINPVAQLPHKTLFHETAHQRSRFYRHRTHAKEPARSRSRVSRFALLRSVEPRRRGVLPRIYPELAMPRHWLQRRRNPRKERSEDFPRRRSSPASRTNTGERGRTRAARNEKGLGKRCHARLAQAPTFNPYRRKIDATKP